MKKLLAILLVIMMLFSVATVFAGCDEGKSKSNKTQKDDDDDDDDDNDDDDDEDDGDDGDDGTTDPDGDVTEPDPTEPGATQPSATEPTPTEPAPTEPAPTEPAPTEPEPTEPIVPPVLENGFALGKISGSTYENTYTGISVEIGDGWTFFADSDINGDSFDRNDPAAASQLAQFYDMYAVSDNGQDNLSIIYTRPSESEMASLDIAEFAEQAFQAALSQLEAFGFECVEYETGMLNIGGSKLNGSAWVMQYSTMYIYQAQCYRVVGDHIIAITISAFSEDAFYDMISWFTVD